MTLAEGPSEPTNEVEPLRSYRAVSTSEIEKAESQGGRLLSPHRLVPIDEAAFEARIHAARLPSVALNYMKYGTELTVDVPRLRGYVAVTMPLTGYMQIDHDNERLIAKAGKGAAVISPGDNVRMRWSPSFSMLCLRIDSCALVESLQRLTGNECRLPLHFRSAIADRCVADIMYGHARLLQSIFETAGASERVPKLLAQQLEEQVLTALLAVQPNNYTELIFSPTANISRRHVREAIDLIESERIAELTIGSLAQTVGVGVRSLEQGFRRELGKSPRQYLHETRLTRAHDELRRSNHTDTTVTDVAMRWGFGHQGRFAKYYRTRFGEPPSHTLRQG